MTTAVCKCACHSGATLLRLYQRPAVDVRSVVEAAVACRSCVDAHCPALLSMRLADEPSDPAELNDADRQPSPAEFCAIEYPDGYKGEGPE